jgi:hypothetical protein
MVALQRPRNNGGAWVSLGWGPAFPFLIYDRV